MKSVDKIGFGIVGTGSVARQFVQDLHRVEGARPAGVASRSKANAERFAGVYGVDRPHAGLEAMLNDDAVDVVYVATPHHRHRDDCLAALAAGKAVLCEKPFATSAAQAEEVLTVAAAAGVFIMEAMWMRFVPAFDAMLDRVNEGWVGEVRSVHADFGVPTELPADSRYLAPDGGGALLDRGVYPLALCVALLGEPEDVSVQRATLPAGVDETTAILLRYANGALACLTCGLTSYGSNDAVIAGTQGRLELAEPLCRPEAVTFRKAPELPAATPDMAAPGAKQKLKQTLRANPLIAAARRLRGSGITRFPVTGHGYAHEIEEVVRCLREGQTQSDCWSWEDTRKVGRLVDRVRGVSEQVIE